MSIRIIILRSEADSGCCFHFSNFVFIFLHSKLSQYISYRFLKKITGLKFIPLCKKKLLTTLSKPAIAKLKLKETC